MGDGQTRPTALSWLAPRARDWWGAITHFDGVAESHVVLQRRICCLLYLYTLGQAAGQAHCEVACTGERQSRREKPSQFPGPRVHATPPPGASAPVPTSSGWRRFALGLLRARRPCVPRPLCAVPFKVRKFCSDDGAQWRTARTGDGHLAWHYWKAEMPDRGAKTGYGQDAAGVSVLRPYNTCPTGLT